MGLTYPAPLQVVKYAFDGSIAVEVGDLMYHDTNDAKPASSQADAGSEAANQAAFAPKFCGVSVERRLASQTDAGDLDIAPDWIGEMTVASSTFEVGDMVTVDEASSGTALEDQVLVKTTNPALAIGYVIQRYASAVTTALVRLMSNVTPPNITGVGAISTTTGIFSTSVTAPVVVFSGATGEPEIRLTANLADALSIEDTAGDLMKFDTTTGSCVVTITPATTVTGLLTSNGGITLSGAVDLTFTGTTGQPEIMLTTNLADALSVKDTAGDLIVVCTTTGAQTITITPPVTISGGLTLGAKLVLNAVTTPVAAAGATVADAGQLGAGSIAHVTSDGATKGVKLRTGVLGDFQRIINNSGTACELYAASGGTVNGLAADASVVIPASKGVDCHCTAADTWIVFDLAAKATAS